MFISVFKYLNSLTPPPLFLINIDSGVFFHCCQGRNTREIGTLASPNVILCTFKCDFEFFFVETYNMMYVILSRTAQQL